MIDTKTLSVTGMVGSRRRTIRVAASHLKAFATSKLTPVEVEDISSGGFLATTHMSLEINSVHVVRFTHDRLAVNTRGRVLHCRPVDRDDEQPSWLIGFAFVGRARPGSSTVDELIDAITTSAISFESF